MRKLTFLLLTIAFIFPSTLSAQEEAATYIEDNPETVAIICMQGDETLVEHNQDDVYALASTAKVIILAEYARQVDAGILDPDEEIDMEDVNTFWIPLLDGGAHGAWMDTLDNDEVATFDQLANAMIQFSSNAASDYLIQRLGRENIAELIDLMGLSDTDVPTYFIGHILAISNHELGRADLDYVASLDHEQFLAEHDRLMDLFINDDEWREADISWRQRNLLGMPSIEVQAAFLGEFTTGSDASDLAILIREPYVGDTLSETAHEVMRQHLGWIFEVNPANSDVYEELGNKGGAYAGVLTAVWYVQPIGGEAVTLVVLYNDLPTDLWQAWSTNGEAQSLELEAVATGAGCAVFEELLSDSNAEN